MDRQGDRLEVVAIFKKILMGMVLFLVLTILLGTAWHEHRDFDHHDCSICLLGTIPFLWIDVVLLFIFWVRLKSVALLPISLPNQVFSQSPSSRAPPVQVW